jgi:hypothetical protein
MIKTMETLRDEDERRHVSFAPTALDPFLLAGHVTNPLSANLDKLPGINLNDSLPPKLNNITRGPYLASFGTQNCVTTGFCFACTPASEEIKFLR